ncbi:MAG: NAD-dependent epimerase/dehydratase family protein [Bacillota bacterium]
MSNQEWHVVTGAFGYTGKYITRRLLAMGKKVITLTDHPGRPNPFGTQVPAVPFNFPLLPKLQSSDFSSGGSVSR